MKALRFEKLKSREVKTDIYDIT